MSKTKKWLIAAGILVVLGLINCGVAFAALGFGFNKLETTEYVTKTYEVTETFDDIDIEADTEKVDLVYAQDGICKVVCVEKADSPHKVCVEENILKISEVPHLGTFKPAVSLHDMSITVYLPEYRYGDINIATDTGDVSLPAGFTFENIQMELDTGHALCSASANQVAQISADSGNVTLSGMSADLLNVETDTGNMALSDIKAGDMSLESDTGRCDLKNCIAGNLYAATGVGNIFFDKCDADTITATSDTGSITGTLLSDKIFVTQTDTGEVNVPASGQGGKCELTTDTGDIEIEVVGQ